MKQYCDYKISPNSFSIISHEDISHAGAKRYGVKILLNQKMSKGEIIQIVKSITDDMIEREYYRNTLVKQHWQGKRANVVWVYVYLSLEDCKCGNCICRSQWIDPKLDDEFRPTKERGLEIGSDLIIIWSDYYESIAKFYQEHRISKEEYIDKINEILCQVHNIVQNIYKLSNQYFEQKVPENKFLKKMGEYEKQVSKFTNQINDIGSAPLECMDLDDKF